MSRQIRHAVILAAGRGRRMLPLTENLPKAMAPYDGSTLIARGIAQISRRIENVHITVGWKGAILAEHVIHCGARSVISTDGHSNSWWIYNTLLAELAEPIFVLTCDNVLELDFERLEADYFAADEPACMVVPVYPVAGLDGDWIFRDGDVVTKISRTDPSDVYCSGVQVIHPRKVQARTDGEGDFTAVWRQLIPYAQVRTSRVYPSQWFAVDTLAELDIAPHRSDPAV
jgi:NDP-sugar pyrophosphorylase family protein